MGAATYGGKGLKGRAAVSGQLQTVTQPGVMPTPTPHTHNQNTFRPTEGQNEQWREANRRRQRQTNRYRGLVPTPPPPPHPMAERGQRHTKRVHEGTGSGLPNATWTTEPTTTPVTPLTSMTPTTFGTLLLGPLHNGNWPAHAQPLEAGEGYPTDVSEACRELQHGQVAVSTLGSGRACPTAVIAFCPFGRSSAPT